MIWKRNDNVKSGVGVDGREGENFTRQNRSDPWSPPKLGSISPRGAGKYTNDDPGLRNKQPGAGTGDAHDIFDNVERNSGNGAPGPIKYGVD